MKNGIIIFGLLTLTLLGCPKPPSPPPNCKGGCDTVVTPPVDSGVPTTYMGKTSPDAGTADAACQTYMSVRGYTILRESLDVIKSGDAIYDSYPTAKTNGDNKWIALKLHGTGIAKPFLIDQSGVIGEIGQPCP
jgi:hypothetical protein